MFNKKLKKELKTLKEGFTIYLEGHTKFLIEQFRINNKLNTRFNSQIESLKSSVRELKRLRDDDLELMASLSLQNSELKKALHNQRESIMLLMEHFNLYFDIEDDEKVVKVDKKRKKK